MEESWRLTARSVTKYNPVFRDEKGHYKRNDWIGFGQIGGSFDDGVLTFESYFDIEQKYIQAAIWFFEFHGCDEIVIRSVEKYDASDYTYEDREEVLALHNNIDEGLVVTINNVGNIVKLILRELLWAELFCTVSEKLALRFGYDFYMYFNSNGNMDELFGRVTGLGLYIY